MPLTLNEIIFALVLPPVVFLIDLAMFPGFAAGYAPIAIWSLAAVGMLSFALSRKYAFSPNAPLLVGSIFGAGLGALGIGIVLLPLSLFGLALYGIGLLGFSPLVVSFFYLRRAKRIFGASVQRTSHRTLAMLATGMLISLGLPTALQAFESQWIDEHFRAIVNNEKGAETSAETLRNYPLCQQGRCKLLLCVRQAKHGRDHREPKDLAEMRQLLRQVSRGQTSDLLEWLIPGQAICPRYD